MKRKGLSTIALLATALLVTVSALPMFVKAQGGTTLSVTPALSGGELGEHFTVTVEVSDVPNLVVYDFVLAYDTRVLTVDSANLGNTLFDLNQNGDISDDPVLIARQDVLEGLGEVRYTVGLLGSGPITVVGSAPLLVLDFVVESLGTSPIEFTDSTLVVVHNPHGTMAWPHETRDGEYRTPAAARFVSPAKGCEAKTRNRFRGVVELRCNVRNTATVSIEVAVEFTWLSLTGQSGVARSPTTTLAPAGMLGSETHISIVFTHARVVDSFMADGSVKRIVMSPDGLLDIDGPSWAFSFDTKQG